MSAVGIWKIAAADPERIAVVAVDGTSTSYEKIAVHSNQLARGLRALGLERGDRVAVVMRNAPELVAIILAAQQIGLYVVPINFHSTADDISFIVKNSGTRAVFVDPAFTRTCQDALDSIDFPQNARFCTRKSAGFETLSDWRRHFSGDRPDDTAAGSVMFYTSGTTGRPKGVLRPLPAGRRRRGRRTTDLDTAGLWHRGRGRRTPGEFTDVPHRRIQPRYGGAALRAGLDNDGRVGAGARTATDRAASGYQYAHGCHALSPPAVP